MQKKQELLLNGSSTTQKSIFTYKKKWAARNSKIDHTSLIHK